MKAAFRQPALRIALLYALLAGGWIAVSDHLVAQLALSPETRERLSVLKGWAFVAVTALLLFGLLRREFAARRNTETALRRSQEQLRALARRLQSVREEESRRIARELHDELGQMLTGLKMDLRGIERDLEAARPDAPTCRWLEKLLAASEQVDAAIRAVQRLCAELRPALVDRLGLPVSLRQEVRQFEERTGMVCRLHLREADSSPPDAIATALYRICQEALTNVARHAHATEVEVELRAAPDAWELEVRDNGRGIAPECLNDPHALGLVGMRERAAQFGGELRLLPRPGGGAVVRARIPRAVPERSAA